jgi:hypothetical protein
MKNFYFDPKPTTSTEDDSVGRWGDFGQTEQEI